MKKNRKITLSSLSGGILEEKFEDAMKQVVSNIIDPNTEAKSVREINIKIKIKPNENREVVIYDASCTTKLTPNKPYQNVLFVGSEEKNIGLFESDSRQEEMEFYKAVTLEN